MDRSNNIQRCTFSVFRIYSSHVARSFFRIFACMVRRYYGSLITAHFFNNSITVVFHYIENQGYELSYFEKLGTIENGTWDIAIYTFDTFYLMQLYLI